ncbi:MAG: hypothetical protein ABIQ99_15760 [Thermoflexales bacterium]
MLDALIENILAQIDDLAELKVTLVALWLIERKGGGTASVDAAEVLAQPALRQGLGFAPDLAIDAALRRAVARGTFLAVRTTAVAGPRYVWTSPDAQRWAVAAEAALARASGQKAVSPADALAPRLTQVIEKLEQIEAAAISADERTLLEEWLGYGYSAGEIEAALRAALAAPRARGSPPRRLRDAAATLKAVPPSAPTAYHRWKSGAIKVPADGMIAFRERASRWPSAAEYAVIAAAIGLHGEPAVVRALGRLVSPEDTSLDGLLPLLAEGQEAALAVERAAALPDPRLVELQRMYEGFTGLPPTAAILTEMGQLLATDAPDLTVWKAAFDYASGQNKRDWRYARAIALNPKPGLYVPGPANDTAKAAFEEYRRRVGRLDEFVATEINTLSATVTDPAAWKDAIDKAAIANALRWDYIKKVLANPDKDRNAKQTHSKTPARRGSPDRTARGSAFRFPQVDDPSDAERSAAEERARQQRAERAQRRKP